MVQSTSRVTTLRDRKDEGRCVLRKVQENTNTTEVQNDVTEESLEENVQSAGQKTLDLSQVKYKKVEILSSR